MFNGSQVREELGLQPQSEKGGVKERIHKSAADKYRVFIQSTSVNRKLIAGTTFLYEVSDLEYDGTVIEDSVETKRTKADTTAKDIKDTKIEAKVKKKTTKKTVKASEVDTATVEEIGKCVEKADKAKKKFKTPSIEEVSKPMTVSSATVGTEVFSDKSVDKASKIFEEIKIDKSKTKIKKTKADKVEKKPVKKVIDTSKVSADMSKVTDGLERYSNSQNKKNTEFLKNNLKKLIADSQKVLDKLS